MVQRYGFVIAAALAVAACGGGGGPGGTTTTGGLGTGGQVSIGGTCATTFMGRSKLMIGAQMADATAAAAPFDARYLYLAGGIRPAGTCATSCSAACNVWWGCWQDPALAPGQYALDHMQRAAGATWQGAARPQVPVFTYYEILQRSGASEGQGEVNAVNDTAFLARYFDDWRFLLQKIGSRQAMLHIEPDFWGYVRQANSNPHAVPAPVTSANAADCAGQENSMAGMARCMIAMVRKYAPNATVGLHASPWTYTMAGDGAATGAFMVALGAANGDFVVTDPSDRDAGYYASIGQPNRWWDDSKAAAYLAWSKAVSDTVGKPTVMWQIPLGNMSQNNTANHWQDNRVDYLFAHLPDVAKSDIVALLFGAGESQQTTPETDGGNLIAKTTANWQAGGTSLCQ
jgi:hypothetical protein